MRRKVSRYWAFQIFGWGLYCAIMIFFATLFNKYTVKLGWRLIFLFEVGILFTHMMREVIRRSQLMMQPLRRQIISFTALTLVFGLLCAGLMSPYEYFCGLNRSDRTYGEILYANSGIFSILLLIWNFIYFMYHFIVKSQRQQMETLQMEAMVKTLELKTIKAHINPHFIFNALNGIRALIDENPARARMAVTELSNILRNSLSAEKNETVPLEDDLKIVRDYLNLEHMRFEDRLRVEYEIDGSTLNLQVPPMMLQTLVENAIKHGISKQVKGGTVRIISDFIPGYHELLIQNTGKLNGAAGNGNSFGIRSTLDRLQLLYGDKARFEIHQKNPDLVEARVLIPVSLN